MEERNNTKQTLTLLVMPDDEWRTKLYAHLIQNGFEEVSQATNWQFSQRQKGSFKKSDFYLQMMY